MGANRTLAVIVFTDVAGFSAIANQDESRAFSMLESDFGLMRRLATMHQGQALKNTGDGMLLVFGSALQAVEWAKGFQTTPRPESTLKHRIGIHVGDVMLSEDDAQGDGVNIASRIQDGAPAGGIWLSATAYDLVKNRAEVAAVPVGPQYFKNLPEPIQCYEIEIEGAERKKPASAPKRPLVSQNAVIAGLAIAVVGLAIVVTGTVMRRSEPVQVTRFVPVLRDRPVPTPPEPKGEAASNAKSQTATPTPSTSGTKPPVTGAEPKAGQAPAAITKKTPTVAATASDAASKSRLDQSNEASGARDLPTLTEAEKQKLLLALKELENLKLDDDGSQEISDSLRNAFESLEKSVPAGPGSPTRPGQPKPLAESMRLQAFAASVGRSKARYEFKEIADVINEAEELPKEVREAAAKKWIRLQEFKEWLSQALEASTEASPIVFGKNSQSKIWKSDRGGYAVESGKAKRILRLTMLPPTTIADIAESLLANQPDPVMQTRLREFEREYRKNGVRFERTGPRVSNWSGRPDSNR